MCKATSDADVQRVVGQAMKKVALSLLDEIPDAVAVDEDTAAYRVIKASDERRYTLGLAYGANLPDVSRAADGYRDAVRPEVLEQTAWTWMAKHRSVGLYHKGGTEGHFTPTESYIYRGPDWHVPSPVDSKTYVIKAGDWLIGGIWDKEGWTAVKRRHANGWSPQGGAQRQAATPDFLAQLRR